MNEFYQCKEEKKLQDLFNDLYPIFSVLWRFHGSFKVDHSVHVEQGILFYSYTCCMQENCHHGQAKWPSLPWVSYGSLVECLKYSSEGRRFHSFREHSMFSPSMPVSFTKSFTNLLHTSRIEMSTCGAHVQWWCEWRWLILILVI